MIAVTILVLALLGLFAVIIHTTRHNTMQRENLAAMRAAEDKIEELMSYDFNNIFTDYSAGGVQGNTFDVTLNVVGTDTFPLEPVAGAASVGTISFPVNAAGDLDEAQTGQFTRSKDPGTPGGFIDIDLDGSGGVPYIDTFLDSSTVNLIPVRIDLNWTGIRGRQSKSYIHILLRK